MNIKSKQLLKKFITISVSSPDLDLTDMPKKGVQIFSEAVP
jgi:hypothetical protein